MNTEQTISCKQNVALETEFFTFVNTIDTGTKIPCHLANWLHAWEKWKVLAYKNKESNFHF